MLISGSQRIPFPGHQQNHPCNLRGLSCPASKPDVHRCKRPILGNINPCCFHWMQKKTQEIAEEVFKESNHTTTTASNSMSLQEFHMKYFRIRNTNPEVVFTNFRRCRMPNGRMLSKRRSSMKPFQCSIPKTSSRGTKQGTLHANRANKQHPK